MLGTKNDVIPPVRKHSVTQTNGTEHWVSTSKPKTTFPRIDATRPIDVCKPKAVELEKMMKMQNKCAGKSGWDI